MARTLTEFQLRRWSEFTHEQQLDLNAYQSSLLNRAHDMQSRAVNPSVDQPRVLTLTVQEAVRDACAGLPELHNLTLALNVGALIVALASYVARANKRGIQTAVDELHHLLAHNIGH